jgi:hypothetical protein
VATGKCLQRLPHRFRSELLPSGLRRVPVCEDPVDVHYSARLRRIDFRFEFPHVSCSYAIGSESNRSVRILICFSQNPRHPCSTSTGLIGRRFGLPRCAANAPMEKGLLAPAGWKSRQPHTVYLTRMAQMRDACCRSHEKSMPEDHSRPFFGEPSILVDDSPVDKDRSYARRRSRGFEKAAHFAYRVFVE